MSHGYDILAGSPTAFLPDDVLAKLSATMRKHMIRDLMQEDDGKYVKDFDRGIMAAAIMAGRDEPRLDKNGHPVPYITSVGDKDRLQYGCVSAPDRRWFSKGFYLLAAPLGITLSKNAFVDIGSDDIVVATYRSPDITRALWAREMPYSPELHGYADLPAPTQDVIAFTIGDLEGRQFAQVALRYAIEARR